MTEEIIKRYKDRATQVLEDIGDLASDILDDDGLSRDVSNEMIGPVEEAYSSFEDFLRLLRI